MNRNLLLVAISLHVWGIGEGTYLYFQSLYLQQLGASPSDIGIILSVVGITMVVTYAPVGHLSDRFGQRPLMWASWFLGTLAAFLMAVARSLPLFIIGMILYGLTASVMAAVNSYVTAVRGKLTVVRAITFVSAMYSAGAIIGPWLGGQVGSQLSLRQVYFVAAGLYFLSSLVILGVQPQPIEHVPADGTHEPLHLSKPYLVYLGVFFLATFAMYLPQPLSSNYLQNQHHLGLAEIGRLGSVASVGIVVLSLALGSLSSRLGLLLGQVALGLFALFLWRGSGLTWFTVGYFLLGGYRLARTMAVAHARSLVRAHNVGLAYGMIETANASAVVLAPWLAGQLYERQPTMMYSTSLGLIFISILITALFVFEKQR